MDAAAIRRWAEDHAAVAARELREMRLAPLPPAEAFKAALSLLAFDEDCNGSPFERRDDLGAEKDQQVWDAWATLRLRWNRGR